MPSLRSTCNSNCGNFNCGNSASMVANACFIPRRRYRGLKRKELRARRGTSESSLKRKSCASLYQKLADMEKASQHEMRSVERKQSNTRPKEAGRQFQQWR